MTRLIAALFLMSTAIVFSTSVHRTVAQAAEKGMTFEIYRDAKEEFRWRLKAANGKIVGTSSESYKAKADCEKSVESIQKGAADATVVDVTTKK